MRDIFYLLTYWFFKFLLFILPDFLLSPFLDLIANLFYKFDKKHNKIIMANLDFAYENELTNEQKKQIAKNVYKNYAKFAINFIKNQNSTKEKILKKVRFRNLEIFTNALNSGRAIIVQTAHYGEWELFSLAMAAKFGPVSIVGRALDSSVMQKILKANRTQFDIELIDKSGGAKQILKAIKERRLLGILVDQNTAKSDGIEVNFFGKRVLHTPSVSIFAQKSDAIIVPAFIKISDEDSKINEICFFEPIDIRNFSKDEAILEATKAQADATEKFIRQKPDEYFWFHKRFKHFNEEIYR
ncbi:lipid A biosynthesis lauroyl acyltransferase [Campylobacter sp. RM16192]|uniref:lipid A biosynthesis lauroyl acyltransferase n=1 Tax=Campylobacter sp. RM16192 TaxID=1660080 RepID=UPI0014529706|nr:lipid A biosynthesis lauroyl acyltransferase [Campylobacter sp. RM16192]QCD52071.1 lipid A biosynthesis lauroyl acyltransferase [Campylobacter sp. RM16192]